MKNIFRIITVVALTFVLSMSAVVAGNDDRRGTAGATELLINPWARSAGWGAVSVANSRGLESFYTNIAGLSFIHSTEVVYSYSSYFGGKGGLNSGASINAFGLGQRLFERGVAGVYVMTMSVGEIPVTTVESPEPGVAGVFSPSIMNINVAYSHSFTASIHGGVVLKVISESTSDISGNGFGLDAGIQYVSGVNDELKFGIALKNIGPSMSFGGTGLSFTFRNAAGNPMTGEFRSAEMELPTSLSIGASYDFHLNDDAQQLLTVAGAFTSNAFLKDNFALGVEWSGWDRVMLRAGYVAQRNIFSSTERTTANTGFSAGASFKVPMGKKEDAPSLELDYAYRMAANLKGTHTIGAVIRL